MEINLFGNPISLYNLAGMAFLYIVTISTALCGTITVDDIKSILSLDFLKKEKEEKEGFANIFGNKKEKKCTQFSQNKCIDENTTHPLHPSNANPMEPGSYNYETNQTTLSNIDM